MRETILNNMIDFMAMPETWDHDRVMIWLHDIGLTFKQKEPFAETPRFDGKKLLKCNKKSLRDMHVKKKATRSNVVKKRNLLKEIQEDTKLWMLSKHIIVEEPMTGEDSPVNARSYNGFIDNPEEEIEVPRKSNIALHSCHY